MHAPYLPDFAQMTRREIEDYLVERAMVEPEFRKGLLETPGEVLRRIGLPVGEDVKICVIEEERRSFYLILPRVLPDLEEGSEAISAMQRFFRGYA